MVGVNFVFGLPFSFVVFACEICMVGQDRNGRSWDVWLTVEMWSVRCGFL